MSIYIYEEIEIPFKFDYKKIINNVIETALDYVKCPYEVEINVSLTDNEKIKEINNDFRGINDPTDVLSFPMIDYITPGEFDFLEKEGLDSFDPDSGELILGDIVISVEKVESQAEEFNHSKERELAFLTAHSMFHLFGYDHEYEKEMEVMEKMQEEVLEKLKITR